CERSAPLQFTSLDPRRTTTTILPEFRILSSSGVIPSFGISRHLSDSSYVGRHQITGGREVGMVRTLRSSLAIGLLAAACFGAAVSLHAQSAQGTLRGLVKDPQGVIPGVTVTMTNTSTNTTRETVTNAVGEFSFPAVEPSSYTVKASVPGY